MNGILKELEDHHDVLGSFAVSLQQLYKWLQGETKDFEIWHPVFFQKSKSYDRDWARLFDLYTDFKIDVKMVSFMWRAAVGGLKTGNIVKKYKIPGARCNCAFCGEQLIETVEHLFFECEALKTVREVAVKFYKNFELSIPSADANAMRLLFTLGLTSSSESKTTTQNIFRVTAEYCYSIWQARNDVLFKKVSCTSIFLIKKTQLLYY